MTTELIQTLWKRFQVLHSQSLFHMAMRCQKAKSFKQTPRPKINQGIFIFPRGRTANVLPPMVKWWHENEK
jgi:hypothetical protein